MVLVSQTMLVETMTGEMMDYLMDKITRKTLLPPERDCCFGETLLHTAVRSKKFEWVRRVLDKAPELVGVKTQSGDLPLHVACAIAAERYKFSPENTKSADDIALLLLEQGSDLRSKNNSKNKALDYKVSPALRAQFEKFKLAKTTDSVAEYSQRNKVRL